MPMPAGPTMAITPPSSIGSTSGISIIRARCASNMRQAWRGSSISAVRSSSSRAIGPDRPMRCSRRQTVACCGLLPCSWFQANEPSCTSSSSRRPDSSERMASNRRGSTGADAGAAAASGTSTCGSTNGSAAVSDCPANNWRLLSLLSWRWPSSAWAVAMRVWVLRSSSSSSALGTRGARADSL
ncbi:hypothetical protein D3C79_765850 [compost metagenome]